MDINELKEDYLKWLKQEISISKMDEYYEMTTPFLDRFNDYIQIYVKLDNNNKITISDDGYIINNLKSSGIDLNSNKRKLLLESMLNKYNITISGDELLTYADIHSFPQKKHLLIQAMLNIDDMFMLSQTRVASIFLDDIQEFFTEKSIYYIDNVSFTGKSGFNHIYDYVIQRSKQHPERLCKAINNGTKSNMESTLFIWNDTKETRQDDSKLIVFLNDENNIERGVLDGFRQYNVDVIPWSSRNDSKILELLSA